MLNNIFNPKSIAVIGASSEEGTVGYNIFGNLINQGFAGKVFPINPKRDQIQGQKAYPTVLGVEEEIDLAIISVPAKIVPLVMESIISKNIKAVIVVSAGFSEVSEEGKELEKQLTEMCNQNNITLIGPNCLGVFNPWINMNASFASKSPQKGSIAFLSQSGALCTSIIDMSSKYNLGFSKFVSLGNKSQCSEVELIEYLDKDEETKVISIYAEKLENAPKIIETLSRTTKPIIILKSGNTEEGSNAAASHTGALASTETLYNALFRQAGFIVAETMIEFIDGLKILQKYPSSKIQNTVIVTNAGGVGVMTTDAVVRSGIKLAQISHSTHSRLQKVLPAYAGFGNPIDLVGDATSIRYKDALDILIEDEAIDSMIILLTPQAMTDSKNIAKIIVDTKNKTKIPIVACFIGGDSLNESIEILKSSDVTTSKYGEEAAKMLGKLVSKQKTSKLTIKSQNRSEHIDAIFQKYSSSKYIRENDAKIILNHYSIPTPKNATYSSIEQISSDDLSKFENKLLAIKILSKDIMHKSDVGGVALNVKPQDIASVFVSMYKTVQSNLPDALLDGIYVEEMIDKSQGTEFILGAKKDHNLGTAIMFGMGGIYTEILKDVSFGFNPLNQEDIESMIKSLKTAPIIDGVRGQLPLDKDAIIASIQGLSQMLIDYPNITEIDINPLFVGAKGKGVVALDGKILFE